MFSKALSCMVSSCESSPFPACKQLDSSMCSWEFFTTLDYEWRVFRGRSPYRWTIWIYSVTRVAGLMGAILSLVGLDVTTPINCQLWISSELFFSYTSLATASLLIVLRIIAIWNMNEIVMSIAIGTWVINVALLIQGVARLRATWVPTELTCVVYNSTENALTLISMAVADIVLLLMMLVGLLRLRYHGCATSGLTHLLWKQGLIWTAVATVAEVPPAVMIVLNLNGPLDIIFQVPAVVTMTIAATRMHRSLVCFTSGSSETPKNVQKSGLEFARANHAHSTTTPPNPMETAVCSILEQHLTPQVDNDSSINTDGQTHVKRNGLSLDSDVDVERGE